MDLEYFSQILIIIIIIIIKYLYSANILKVQKRFKLFGKMKHYKKKIEMLKIAFTSYEKVLVELRSALRGDEFDKDQFIDKMKVIDEMIIDQTPLADKYVKLYDKKWK